nr:MAG TPA: hypothetical protein [Caudoviricetes sp.]
MYRIIVHTYYIYNIMLVRDVRTHARAKDKRDRAVTYRMVAITGSKSIHLILF